MFCKHAVLHNYGNQTNPTFTIRLMALQEPDQLDVLTKKGSFWELCNRACKQVALPIKSDLPKKSESCP